jgi:hypothetical protein
VSVATEVVAVSLAGGSLVISGWAAVTAHKAREWQQRRDAERRTTRVHVEFLHSSGPAAHWPLMAMGNTLSPPAPTVYALTLVVVNDGEVREYVNAAFVRSTVTSEEVPGLRVFGSEGHGDIEPHELDPRSRFNVTVELDDEQIAWMNQGFVGEAWLGSGQEVISPVQHLEGALLDNLAS